MNNDELKPIKLAVSATFTSEPVKDHVVWWGEQFGYKIDVIFADYNQVFQELSSERSLLSTNDGVNLLLVRFEDWIRTVKMSDIKMVGKLEDFFDELVELFSEKNKNVPYFVGLFPVSTHLDLSDDLAEHLEDLYERWQEELEELDDVYIVDFNPLQQRYSVESVFDPLTDREGHLPFSGDYYAAMGAAIARSICGYIENDLKEDTMELLENNRLFPQEMYTAKDLLELQAFKGAEEFAGVEQEDAPRNEIDRKLVEIWENLLKQRVPGINTSFFALGGDSLKAVTLIAEMHKAFNVQLSLNDLFDMKTVKEMADLAAQKEESLYKAIEPAGEQDHYPLASAQKRLYLLNLMDPESVSYNIPKLYLLEEEPDRDRLKNAFDTLIGRHESFRTSFEMIDKELVQKIHDHVDIAIEEYDLKSKALRKERDVRSSSRRGGMDLLIDEIMKRFVRHFDLSQAPLMRAGILKAPGGHCFLMVDMHHIISDGITFEIFKRELMELYDSANLPPVKVQYKDFAVWQAKADHGKSHKEQEVYWLKTLEGEIPALNLPADFQRPTVQSYAGSTLFFELGKEETDALENTAIKEGATLFMILIAAFKICVAKLAALEDVVVGTPVGGRRHPDIENIIGMFVNSLALRSQPEGKKSFHTYLQEIKKCTLDAFEHQEYPFEELVESLGVDRDVSRNPLFDVMFVLQNMESEDISKHSLKLRNHSFRRTAARLDITMFTEMMENGGLLFDFEYCTKLFSEKTINRFFRYFKNIMLTVVNTPGIEIADIQIIEDRERQEILFEFNKTNVEYPRDKTIHELFEIQVDKTPESDAVEFRGESLSYKELDEKANRLAHVLRRKGVGPDNIAGIMISRSFEMMVALLAVLKAGGAYVPIDPEYPIERIKFYMQDSDAKLLLTQPDIIKKFEESGGAVVEGLNLFDDRIYSSDKRRLETITSPHELAYIIYTSGSTGKPKGVMIRHRNAVNFFKGMTDQIDFSPGKSILALTTVSFDIFLLETLLPVTVGVKVVVADEKQQKDPDLLKGLLTSSNVTLLQATPSRLKLLLSSSSDFDCLNRVEQVLVGGEPFPGDLFERLKENYRGRIIDVYGPTETTVWSTMQDLTGKNSIDIGIPIANTQIYIVDKYMNLLPVGVAGELYIGGDGVARGYLNRPELTAERFIPNPFPETDDPDRPYKEIYQTGDLARWLPNGNIECLGRIDHQVKIRGFRIETGEIETQIIQQQDQAIKEAVVMARDDTSGEKFLCAYIVAEEKVDIPALEETLARSLLEYMIPSYFVQIDVMPLTPNGKVDRKKLPAPNIKARGESYVAPRDETEKKLVEIWSELLNIKTDIISIDDSFFKLGGHSLKAAVLITMIHKELNVKMLMHEIFNMATIRKLAAHIKGAVKETYSSIEKAPEKEYYPQTPAQKRLFFIGQLEKDSILYNIQIMDVYCKGIELEPLTEAFRKLILRHESLRSSFHNIDGEAVFKVHDYEEVGPHFTIEYYETREDGMIYSEEEGKEWTQVTGIAFQEVVEHFVKPFDVAKPPLIRAGLIKILGDTQILMLDMHHLISDGTSMVLIVKDLWALYDEEELSRLNAQYRDFAEWFVAEEQQAKIKKQEDFWLKQFQGEIGMLNLPYDHPRPSKMTYDGNMLHFEIGKEDTERLNAMAREQGETLYMVLLAAFNVLLVKLSGQDEVVVGTFAAGRGHADLQDIVGMFVTTLALRTYPTGEKTFKEYLKEVMDHAISAFENQDYPFDQLVSKVAPNYERNRNPLFDVVFGLDNEAESSEEYLLEVLMLDKSNPYNTRQARFDMTMIGAETEEGLQFTLEYNTALFEEETVERFVKYFRKIIALVSDNIRQKISEIELISDVERARIIYELNDTALVYRHEKTIHELFEIQAAKTPEAVAVIYRGTDMSYRELDEKSNQLAHVLRDKGVGPDDLVGIMVPRSQYMMIGLLGILKAGGAYVPIDPEYPSDRIEYMIRDSSGKIILIQQDVMAKYHDTGVGIEAIDVADPGVYTIEETKAALENRTSPHDLAYAIYTSGSTGKPKGVAIKHRNAVNFFKGMIDTVDFSPGKKILALTTICFDIFLLETLLPVTIGLTVVVAEESQQRDPVSLKKLITEGNLDLLQLTPSRLKLLLASSDEYDYLNSIEDILVGGEQFPQKLFEELKTIYRGNIVDVYGPTETTVWSTTKDLTGQEDITIGVPIANTQVYIIDKNMILQPVGVVGELYIGGDGVASGYLNRPELTDERFVDNPFDFFDDPDRPYKKIYQTGDLARWLPNGELECLGRIDHQVKIRGFRIETGEIETQLLKVDSVEEAVVIVREDASGDKYLCAYLVAQEELDMAAVREPVADTLPDYMVPSYFMQIGKIPLTPNGKVDRKSLPEPEGSVMASEYVAPTNEIEEALAEVWGDVLGIEKVGIDDNFFQIGGDSLKTILISGRLQKRDFTIDINDLFANRTIRGLAKYVKTTAGDVENKGEAVDKEAVKRGIETDYKLYLEKVKQEKWPDLTRKKGYKHILLTGATGYLGAYLLFELITATDAVLYLPVRGINNEDAGVRLKKKLAFYFGDSYFEKHKERLVIMRSDLTEERLGIEQVTYEKMKTRVDAVVHSAANVKHYGAYEELYKDNVESTEQLLDFALENSRKDFHFISTMDTGRGDIPGRKHVVFTEYNLDEGQVMDHVYIKSKLEAEKRVMAYRKKGLNASIYRAGNVTFHTKTGMFQENIENNAFYAIMKGVMKVGFLSENMKKMEFDLSFIDYSARSIVLLLTRAELNNQIYHLSNPNRVAITELVRLIKMAGIDVPDVEQGKIEEHLARFDGDPQYERVIERVRLDSWAWDKKQHTVTIPKVDRTVHILEQLGLVWPGVNKEHMAKMIAYCEEVGFL